MENTLTLTQTGIGKKALVALTGLILFGFVVGHLIGNLQIFLAPEHINEYSAFLHSVPKLLWTARVILLVSLIVHVYLTIELSMRNGAARKSRYRVTADSAKQSPLEKYARKTMILSGPIIFAFVCFHLAHLTLGAVPQFPMSAEGDVYANVVHGFRSPLVAGTYVFANVLLGFHLFHGGHSLLQSLGLRSPRIDPQLRGAAMAFAVFVTLGNVTIPLAILGGLVGGSVP